MIVGVDYSISCPAVCVLDDRGEFMYSQIHFLTKVKKHLDHDSLHISCELHKPFKDQQERIDHISNSVIQFIESRHGARSDPVNIYLEDYAMGAKGRVFDIGEATGLFKHKVHQRPYMSLHTVAPTELKKFATGKGNADKNRMWQALDGEVANLKDLLKWWASESADVKSPISDIVDAYWLARYGASRAS